MLLNRRTLLLFGATALAQLAAGTAKADLLSKERWATAQGQWMNVPYTWLAGDFDGNGKTDLAYVYQSCESCPVLGNPFVSAHLDSIDLHLSCDNAKVPCPPGTSKGLVLEHTTSASGFSIPDGNQCDGVHGDCQWVSGDFDGNGVSDFAFVDGLGGKVSIYVGLTAPAASASSLPTVSWCEWGANTGSWIGTNTWAAGDFNGDGKDDLAYVFDQDNQVNIDVYESNGSCSLGFTKQRWATDQGAWLDGSFLASDFNGDGFADVGYAFDDSGTISINAFMSFNNAFSAQRWATHQGTWASQSQWTAVSGALNHRGRVPGVSLISPLGTQHPGNGLGGAGLGDLIYAFDDNGSVSVDGHLANLNHLGSSSGVFNAQRYATRQGTFVTTGANGSPRFNGGDFDGDHVGDVAFAFDDNGDISVDVYRGICTGPLSLSGQCCLAFENVCNGQCCFGTCSNSPAAVNGCCEYGMNCPPPPPPR